MVDRTNWDQWEMQGGKKHRERANELIDEHHEEYDVPPLEPALDAEIRELFTSNCKVEGVTLPELEG